MSEVRGRCAGFMPSSELLRHSMVQKWFSRVIQHGLLRFRKRTRTCTQAAVDVCNLALDQTFKGMYSLDQRRPVVLYTCCIGVLCRTCRG